MLRLLMVGLMLVGGVVVVPSLACRPALAQTGQSAAAEDPNDKSEQERSFEETRKHMQLHSEWSKKSGKMNDK